MILPLRSLVRRLRAALAATPTQVSTHDYQPLQTHSLCNFDDFASYCENSDAELRARQRIELSLITDNVSFTTKGYCFLCSRDVSFHTDFLYGAEAVIDGVKIPNWRERMLCSVCHMNNRTRASIQFLKEILHCKPDSTLYISEQTTPLYLYLAGQYKNLTGSEYLGDRIAFGATDKESGLRNESITKLTFPDAAFDFVLSFDVFEHVPEYEKALKECFRVLKPGGKLLFTVPFGLNNPANLVRASVDAAGTVTHLMEPEYHGDPINEQGCLCFYHFGWQLLDELKSVGFNSVAAHLYWSDKLGYLGQHQVLFCANR